MKYIIITIITLITSCSTNTLSDKEKVQANKHFRKGFMLFTEAESSYTITEEAITVSKTQKEKFSLAEKEFKECLKINPNVSEAYLFLGNIYWANDEISKAIKYYDHSLEIDPARDEILSARIALLLEDNQLEKAKKDLARLKDLESEFYESSKEEIKNYETKK